MSPQCFKVLVRIIVVCCSQDPGRCASFHPNGEVLAVGTMTGRYANSILSWNSLASVFIGCLFLCFCLFNVSLFLCVSVTECPFFSSMFSFACLRICVGDFFFCSSA